MTDMTVNQAVDGDGFPTSSGKELFDSIQAAGVFDDLFEQVDEGALAADPQGFIRSMLAATLQRGLDAELTGHLGYDKGEPTAALFPNSRNGHYPKTVATQVGPVELAIPRDRAGSFTPALVPKGARRLGNGLDDMIISLYAGGMTVRDIEHHLASTIGVELSRETISNITDAVLEEVLAWQSRPLDALYPVIYLDADKINNQRPAILLKDGSPD